MKKSDTLELVPNQADKMAEKGFIPWTFACNDLRIHVPVNATGNGVTKSLLQRL